MSAPPGFRLLPARLDLKAQQALVQEVLALIEAAPPACYQTPGGRVMSVAMTSLGALGWVSDGRGYRYAATHPGRPCRSPYWTSGQTWPIPGRPRTPAWSISIGVARAWACTRTATRPS